MPRKPTPYRGEEKEGNPRRRGRWSRAFQKLLREHEETVTREEETGQETETYGVDDVEGIHRDYQEGSTQTDEGKDRVVVVEESREAPKVQGTFERWWWTGLGLGLGLGVAIFLVLLFLSVLAYILPPSAYR